MLLLGVTIIGGSESSIAPVTPLLLAAIDKLSLVLLQVSIRKGPNGMVSDAAQIK